MIDVYFHYYKFRSFQENSWRLNNFPLKPLEIRIPVIEWSNFQWTDAIEMCQVYSYILTVGYFVATSQISSYDYKSTIDIDHVKVRYCT